MQHVATKMLLRQGVRKTIYMTQLLDQKINGQPQSSWKAQLGRYRGDVANFNNQLYIFSSVPTEE